MHSCHSTANFCYTRCVKSDPKLTPACRLRCFAHHLWRCDVWRCDDHPFPAKSEQVNFVKSSTLTGIRECFDYQYPPFDAEGRLPHVTMHQASLIGTGVQVKLTSTSIVWPNQDAAVQSPICRTGAQSARSQGCTCVSVSHRARM